MSDPLTSFADVQAFLGLVIPRASSIDTDPASVAKTKQVVAVGVRLSPVEQLEIYREQFWLRHVGAMKEDFVTVHHLLGDDEFQLLCAAYFLAYPPKSFTLRDLGERFAEFLQTAEPWAKDALLHDCARLEWAFVEAFDAPDAPPLDPTTIAEAPEDAWGHARVILHPSVQLLELSYAAHIFRRDVRDEESPERPTPAPTCVVVYRGPEKLMYIALEPLAFELLRLLAKGELLAPACERVAAEAQIADSSELEGKVGAWFQAWAAYGWVSRVEFPARETEASS
jgi:hypothetical protein